MVDQEYDDSWLASWQYRRGVRQFYKDIDEGETPGFDRIHTISSFGRAEQQYETLAFLTSESRLVLREVCDLYLSDFNERADFLGFQVSTYSGASMQDRDMVPTIKAMSKETKEKMEAAKKERVAADAATLTDIDMRGVVHRYDFIPRRAIHLNELQTMDVRYLDEMEVRIEKKVTDSVSEIRKQLAPFWMTFRPKKVRDLLHEKATLHGLYRKLRDKRSELLSLIYAEAMQVPAERWAREQAEDKYCEYLEILGSGAF